MNTLKTIAISNQKGGVAKTTTAVNLAASLSVLGERVLLIDLDPQGNATMGCGINKRTLKQSMVDVCLREASLAEVAMPTDYEGLFVAPSNQDLTAGEVEMRALPKAPFILRENVQALAESHAFDVVVIDCPPALNILTVNAMAASDYIIVPMQCEYYALEGLASLLDTVADLQRSVSRDVQVLGFLRTMYDGRSRLAKDVSAELESVLGELVFDTLIPRNVRLAEAPSYGQPAHYYERSSKGAMAYRDFAVEVVKRMVELEEKAK